MSLSIATGLSWPRHPSSKTRTYRATRPEIQPDVTEYRRHRVTCACGATTCGELPAGVPAGMLGPGVLALIAVLVGECHLRRRVPRSSSTCSASRSPSAR